MMISNDLDNFKVMFVIPKDQYPEASFLPHTGIAYLSAFLKSHNADISVVNLDLGDNLRNLTEYFNPDLIGFTSFSFRHKKVYSLIDEIKEQNKNYRVAIGGPHASLIHKNILYETKADFALIGESEKSLYELCKSLKTSGKFGNNPDDFGEIKGIIWRKGGRVIENPSAGYVQNLDELPFPAYNLFSLKRYKCFNIKRLPILTSRGCPYACGFCAVKCLMGQKFRTRSVENIIAEIEHWYKQGWNNFDINDDCFNFDIQRAKKICDAIIKNKLKITFQLYNGIRVNKIDKELLYKLKNAGCQLVNFGVESGNQDVLNYIKKGITLKQVREAVDLANEVGITNAVNFIIGHPTETYEKAMDSIKFAESLPTGSTHFYSILPNPGTETYAWVKKNGRFLYTEEEYLDMSSSWSGKAVPIFETDDFPLRDRTNALKKGIQTYRKKLIQSSLGNRIGLVVFYFIRFDFVWNVVYGVLTRQKLGQNLLRKIIKLKKK